jgi:tetratricopeptide (TPR) repeat protein
MATRRLTVAAACLAAALGGAAYGSLAQAGDSPPESLRPLYARLQSGGRRDEVLNRMELATSELYLGDLPQAASHLDAALDLIEAVWANSEQAAKARSLWHNEGEKDFKGEPYERLMVYYYRGLIYLANDDFENAAVLFKGGLAQDGFAEEAQNRANFAILMFLEGWADQCRGNAHDAAEHYAEAQSFRPDLPIPKPGDRVLTVLETGRSPRKVADGMGHGELKFRRGRNFTEVRARLANDESAFDLYPLEDIFLKASTRGGRPVDAIIHGKVVFRQDADVSGSVLSDASRTALLGASVANTVKMMPGAGAGIAINGSALNGAALGQIGAAVGVVSIVTMAMAANTGTQADIRYWGGLPDAVHVMTAANIPGATSRAVYLDAQRGPLTDAGLNTAVRSYGNLCRLIWGRSRAPDPAPLPAR